MRQQSGLHRTFRPSFFAIRPTKTAGTPCIHGDLYCMKFQVSTRCGRVSQYHDAEREARTLMVKLAVKPIFLEPPRK